MRPTVVEFPSDWIRHFGVNLVTAIPPQGGGRFRYFQRLRPQASFGTIVRRMLAGDALFRVQHVGRMVRVVTAEGEYGAWVRIEGTREGGRALRLVGALFLGEFATALDTIVIVPAMFAELERRSFDLLYNEKHGMTRRPRQFFYLPPADWQGIPSGLTTNWYPPDFPRNRSNIAVQPAVFLEGSAEDAVETTFAAAGAGLAVSSSSRDRLTAISGVKGQTLSLQGRRPGRTELVHRELAIFVVPPYAYRMNLETMSVERLAELRSLFGAVAGSFRPLPDVEERRAGHAGGNISSDVFDSWAS